MFSWDKRISAFMIMLHGGQDTRRILLLSQISDNGHHMGDTGLHFEFQSNPPELQSSPQNCQRACLSWGWMKGIYKSPLPPPLPPGGVSLAVDSSSSSSSSSRDNQLPRVELNCARLHAKRLPHAQSSPKPWEVLVTTILQTLKRREVS